METILTPEYVEELLTYAFTAGFYEGESYGVAKTREPDYYMFKGSPLKEELEKFLKENKL